MMGLTDPDELQDQRADGGGVGREKGLPQRGRSSLAAAVSSGITADDVYRARLSYNSHVARMLEVKSEATAGTAPNWERNFSRAL